MKKEIIKYLLIAMVAISGMMIMGACQSDGDEDISTPANSSEVIDFLNSCNNIRYELVEKVWKDYDGKWTDEYPYPVMLGGSPSDIRQELFLSDGYIYQKQYMSLVYGDTEIPGYTPPQSYLSHNLSELNCSYAEWISYTFMAVRRQARTSRIQEPELYVRTSIRNEGNCIIIRRSQVLNISNNKLTLYHESELLDKPYIEKGRYHGEPFEGFTNTDILVNRTSDIAEYWIYFIDYLIGRQGEILYDMNKDGTIGVNLTEFKEEVRAYFRAAEEEAN